MDQSNAIREEYWVSAVKKCGSNARWTENPSELSELDRVRFFLVSRARWLRMQNAFFQWRRGTLSNEDWTLYNGWICTAGTGGAMRFATNWGEHNVALAASFVEFVDSCWSDSQ